MAHDETRSAAHPCPFVARGIELRAACAGCSGRAAAGQRTLPPAEVVFRAGEPATRLGLVVEGWLRESLMDQSGKVAATRFIGPGGIVGVEALKGGEYRASVDVLCEARLCVLEAEQARTWLGEHPDLAMGVTEALIDDLSTLRQQLADNASLSAAERVARLVASFGHGTPEGEWFELPVTREQMGELLGLTVETVSRCVQKLARGGRLEVRGRRIRRIG